MLIDFNRIVRVYGRPKGILHVGANTGQEAETYSKNGVNKVIWIEALPHVYEELVRNVKYFGHTCINACVGDVDGQEVEFHESNNESQSSSFLELGTHKTAHPEVHYIKSYKMQTKRLDSIMNEIDCTDVDMICLDIQGAEMLALKGLADRINQFNKIYMEVNTVEVYKGCALLPDIEKYLKQFGFYKKEEKIFKQWGWGDVLFTK